MKKNKRKIKAWSVEDVDFLENNCHMSVEQLSKKLKRSKASVSQKMNKLGYTKSRLLELKEVSKTNER